MKEKEFLKKYPQLELAINIYYTLNDGGDVVLDEESMREEFDNAFKILQDNLK